MGLTRDQQKQKMEAELKAAIAAKPPASAKVEEADYVPPPVVNLQETIPNPRRRPLPSETDQTAAREASQRQVEDTIVQIAKETRSEYVPPTPEAVENAHNESVRLLKVQWAKMQAVGLMPKYDVETAQSREQKAHQDNLEYVKAEMARSIHTEDYSG